MYPNPSITQVTKPYEFDGEKDEINSKIVQDTNPTYKKHIQPQLTRKPYRFSRQKPHHSANSWKARVQKG